MVSKVPLGFFCIRVEFYQEQPGLELVFVNTCVSIAVLVLHDLSSQILSNYFLRTFHART